MAVTSEKGLKVTRGLQDEDDRRRLPSVAARLYNIIVYTHTHAARPITATLGVGAHVCVCAGCIVTVNAVGSHYGTQWLLDTARSYLLAVSARALTYALGTTRTYNAYTPTQTHAHVKVHAYQI
jgi:hypothetical protein